MTSWISDIVIIWHRLSKTIKNIHFPFWLYYIDGVNKLILKVEQLADEMYQLKLKKNRSIVSVIDAGMFGTLFINTPKVVLKVVFFFLFSVILYLFLTLWLSYLLLYQKDIHIFPNSPFWMWVFFTRSWLLLLFHGRFIFLLKQ